MQEVYEILLCFLCYDFNVEKAHKYLEETKNIKISKITLLGIYQKIRNVIHQYMNIVYESEFISEENKREFFSADESLINHSNNTQTHYHSIFYLSILFHQISIYHYNNTTFLFFLH